MIDQMYSIVPTISKGLYKTLRAATPPNSVKVI